MLLVLEVVLIKPFSMLAFLNNQNFFFFPSVFGLSLFDTIQRQYNNARNNTQYSNIQIYKDVWKDLPHGHALRTGEKRNKITLPTFPCGICIGCQVYSRNGQYHNKYIEDSNFLLLLSKNGFLSPFLNVCIPNKKERRKKLYSFHLIKLKKCTGNPLPATSCIVDVIY